jgi:hypothetical protein
VRSSWDREQQAMGADQLFDPRRRPVEAVGEACDLVAPADRNPGREVAGAERFDALLQPLDPFGEPAHHRIGEDGDDERRDQEEADDAGQWTGNARRPARHDPALIRQTEAPCRRANAADPAEVQRRRHRMTGRGDGHPGCIEQPEIGVQALRQMLERLLLQPSRRIRRRQRGHGEFTCDLEGMAVGRLGLAEPPEQSDDHHHGEKACEKHQVDFLVEAAHRSLVICRDAHARHSCALAKT